MPINPFLNYYSRRDIQEEIAHNSTNREVVPKYNEQFGKRPDTIKYPNDMLELAKNGATSFHASEEIWKNPLHLSTQLSKYELDNLRIGWDLIIDIDCPYWDYSKLIAQSIINSLKEHRVTSISCKFSGNKGFHIGIPFESFPQKISNKETKFLFPDAPRTIAEYLMYHIDVGSRLTNKILSKGIEKVKEITGKNHNELIIKFCKSCNSKINVSEEKFEYICPYCNSRELQEKKEHFKKCQKCKRQMEKKSLVGKNKCNNCKSEDFYDKLNLSIILNIDSLLISPRHLYRMPYSIHEKSGLASIPTNPDNILYFDKKDAEIKDIKISKYRFLDKNKASYEEAALLFDEALSWKSSLEQYEKLRYSIEKPVFEKKLQNIESIHLPLPEYYFPPCINHILSGMEDGKKRALFILMNFLSSVKWDYDMIEKRILEWNGKNATPLRQNYIIGHLRYHKHSKNKILPPNCPKRNNNIPISTQQNYYTDINICKPDNFCAKIKNPVNYSIRKWRLSSRIKEEKAKK